MQSEYRHDWRGKCGIFFKNIDSILEGKKPLRYILEQTEVAIIASEKMLNEHWEDSYNNIDCVTYKYMPGLGRFEIEALRIDNISQNTDIKKYPDRRYTNMSKIRYNINGKEIAISYDEDKEVPIKSVWFEVKDIKYYIPVTSKNINYLLKVRNSIEIEIQTTNEYELQVTNYKW